MAAACATIGTATGSVHENCSRGSPDLFSMVPSTSAQFAVVRGKSRGGGQGHAIVTLVDRKYIEVALNYLAAAKPATRSLMTVFVTDDAALATLSPYAARVYLPRIEGECDALTPLMMLKHAIILSVMRAARELLEYVTWADADCLLVKTYDDFLRDETAKLPERDQSFDIVAQRGLWPGFVSSQVGASVCVGLYSLRPSALPFYESFWCAMNDPRRAAEEWLSACREGDDQTSLNLHALKWGGLSFQKPISYVDYRSGRGLDVSLPGSRGVASFRVAFLPYAEYPRGEPREFRSRQVGSHTWKQLLRGGARAWHLQADKIGAAKKQQMKEDGVWFLGSNGSLNRSGRPHAARERCRRGLLNEGQC